MMGTPEQEEERNSDETLHQVTMTKGFWMAKYEVTQQQWMSVMGVNPSHYLGDKLPVGNVCWYECQLFCERAGLALPTEAEWEYACRAGSSGAYGRIDPLEMMAWYGESGSAPHPVGQKRPNAWGLYDMHGNVWEWCADWYGDYPDRAVTDPKGPDSGVEYVLRGGCSWTAPKVCRSAQRFCAAPDHGFYTYGFRPVVRVD